MTLPPCLGTAALWPLFFLSEDPTLRLQFIHSCLLKDIVWISCPGFEWQHKTGTVCLWVSLLSVWQATWQGTIGRKVTLAHGLRGQPSMVGKWHSWPWWRGCKAVCSHLSRSGSTDGNAGAQVTFSFVPLYSVWVPSSWDSATHTQGLSFLGDHLWKCPHNCPKMCHLGDSNSII